MSTSHEDEQGLGTAGRAFRAFFSELQARFLEREDVLLQLQLALLAREHVLVVGPPGTGKSALAESVLGRILEAGADGDPGRPSLFSRQLTESTVQTDLVGPVDFKVLTETGRTEYLTDEGMLGARFAFLDEVFDGRDMLLRAILNVLHERELKHGRRVTLGQVQTAVLTSNRYLSEVLERSPELLVAFADRVAFVAYVPKTFLHPRSRASMLEQGLRGKRPQPSTHLPAGALTTLQALVTEVEVPSRVASALEALADGLERRVLARVGALPGYRPTRIFSQRGLVKAQDVLRAAVVHALVWREPGRELVARLSDLEAVRTSLVLGGPRGEGLETLRAQAADPRERQQLEIVRLEHEAFDEALAEALAGVSRAEFKEADQLGIDRWVDATAALGDTVEPGALLRVLKGLAAGLLPGPRHALNRPPLVGSARTALLVLRQHLQQELRTAVGFGGAQTLEALEQGLRLVRGVPELADDQAPVASAGADWLAQRAGLVSTEVETRALEPAEDLGALAELSEELAREISSLEALTRALAELGARSVLSEGHPAVVLRPRVARALRRCVRAAFQALPLEAEGTGRPLAYRQLEPLLIAIDPSLRALREELVEPILRRRAVAELASVEVASVDAVARWLRGTLNHFALEGLPLGLLMAELSPLLSAWLEARVGMLESRPVEEVTVRRTELFDASIYGDYVNGFSRTIGDGESGALDELARMLVGSGHGEGIVTPGLRERLTELELRALEARSGYLAHWFEQLLHALPPPSEVQTPTEARAVLDRLVKSHFPLLALREGELFRIASGATRLGATGPGRDARVREVHVRIERLQGSLETYGEGLLALQEP